MVRESLDPGARHAFLCMSAGNGTALQWRSTQNGATQSMHGADTTGFPRWLRIVRTGNDINAYTSHDGVNWTQSRGVGLVLPPTALVGLAVTSHHDGTIATATFDNVRISGAPPPGPGLPAAPEGLLLDVASAKQIDLSWTDRATNEASFEIERSTDNASFTRVGATVSNITSFADTGAQPSTTYYYRVRAANAQGFSAFTPVKSATTPAASPAPSAWEFDDIGHVGLAGSNTSSGNTITVHGAGHDIWENADGFRFVYRQLTGNGLVEAQVTSLTNTNPWAKAGVMIRQTLAPESRNVFVFATPNNGIAAQARTTAGGTTSFTPGPWANAPHWLRLVRTANRITAYASPDAITWTEIAAYDIEMSSTVYVGFAVTSHDKTQLNTAVFTDPFVE
jgi:regulation of enolase protein 1 (concanavalin A-like superfamily)